MPRFSQLLVLSTAALMLGLAGCSPARRGPETVRVAGTVYLDGEPLEGAEVRFFSEDFVGVAVSGADGSYELVQGAVPGTNVVTVQKIEGDFELDPESGYDLAQLEFEREAAAGGPGMAPASDANSKVKLLVPAHYSDPSKSKLTYDVPPEGTETADLRLTR